MTPLPGTNAPARSKRSLTRQTLCVAQREYLATVRTKGFIIGLFVAPALMFIAILAVPLLQGHRDTKDRPIAIIDHTGRLAAAIERAATERNENDVYNPKSGKKQAPAYLIETVTPDTHSPQSQLLSLSTRVRQKQLHAFVEIESGVIHPDENTNTASMKYHAPGAALDDTRGWLANTINQQLRLQRLLDAGVDEDAAPAIMHSIALQPMSLLSTNTETGEIQQAKRHNELATVASTLAPALIMYFMILMAALPMLNAVMEEKTQRIAEVLLGAAPPFALMAGKVISALAVALTGACVYLALGISSGALLPTLDFIPWKILPWFLLYLGPAIVMFAAMSAALGAACNDPKDAQNLTFPVIMPAIIPMFFVAPIITEPSGSLSTLLSLFPPFSPVLMLARLGHPNGAPWWQGLLGFIGVLLTATLAVWIASRIFRVAILTQGATPRLRDLVRWTLKG